MGEKFDPEACILKGCYRPVRWYGMCDRHDYLMAAVTRVSSAKIVDVNAYLANERCYRGHWKHGANVELYEDSPGRTYCVLCRVARQVAKAKEGSGGAQHVETYLDKLVAGATKPGTLQYAVVRAALDREDVEWTVNNLPSRDAQTKPVKNTAELKRPSQVKEPRALRQDEVGEVKKCARGHLIVGANRTKTGSCILCWQAGIKRGKYLKEGYDDLPLEEFCTILAEEAQPGTRTYEVTRAAFGEEEQA